MYKHFLAFTKFAHYKHWNIEVLGVLSLISILKWNFKSPLFFISPAELGQKFYRLERGVSAPDIILCLQPLCVWFEEFRGKKKGCSCIRSFLLSTSCAAGGADSRSTAQVTQSNWVSNKATESITTNTDEAEAGCFWGADQMKEKLKTQIEGMFLFIFYAGKIEAGAAALDCEFLASDGGWLTWASWLESKIWIFCFPIFWVWQTCRFKTWDLWQFWSFQMLHAFYVQKEFFWNFLWDFPFYSVFQSPLMFTEDWHKTIAVNAESFIFIHVVDFTGLAPVL